MTFSCVDSLDLQFCGVCVCMYVSMSVHVCTCMLSCVYSVHCRWVFVMCGHVCVCKL